MFNLRVKPREADEVTILDAREVVIDFAHGVIRYNNHTEGGTQSGEYALAELDDIDWDELEDVSPFSHLTTYQHRAMMNLPPKIAGAPDQTFEPVVPKIASPTPVKVPDVEMNEVVGASK